MKIKQLANKYGYNNLNVFTKSRKTSKEYEEKIVANFVLDFETSYTCNKKKAVFVYAIVLKEIGEENVYYFNNLDEFWKFINNDLMFVTTNFFVHNLSFDLKFLLHYILSNKLMKQSFPLFKENKEGFKYRQQKYKKDFTLYEKINTKVGNREEFTFEFAENMGTFYSCDFYLNRLFPSRKNRPIKHIKFIDSYKRIPMSLKNGLKSFCSMDMAKDGIDHSIIRPKNYVLNDNEMIYLLEDALALETIISKVVFEGVPIGETLEKVYFDKLTTASFSLSSYKDTLVDKFIKMEWLHMEQFQAWKKYNKPLDKRIDKNLLFELLFPKFNVNSSTGFGLDSFVRRSYFGGMTHLFKENLNKFLKLGKVFGQYFDVTSLYPFIMKQCKLPYGHGHRYDGFHGHIDIDDQQTYDFYFQEFTVKKFKLKEGKTPCLQIKNNINFKSTEYVESNLVKDKENGDYYEPLKLVLAKPLFEEFIKNYDIIGLRPTKGLMFKSCVGLFEDFINKFSKMKNYGDGLQDKDGNWIIPKDESIRSTAKVILNAIYGKYGSSIVKSESFARVENGVLSFVNHDANEEYYHYTSDSFYIPMASAITSYAKQYLLNAINSNRERIIYCDTDSIMVYGFEPVEGINIDSKNTKEYGLWKVEGSFSDSVFLGKKRYGLKMIDERTKEEEWQFKCAGLSREISKNLSDDDKENFINFDCDYNMEMFDVKRKDKLNKKFNKLFEEGEIENQGIYYYYKGNKIRGLFKQNKARNIIGGVAIEPTPYKLTNLIIE